MSAAVIIARVTGAKNGQRRVTIPKDDATLEVGDWVEIRPVRLASERRVGPETTDQPSDGSNPALDRRSNWQGTD